MSLEIDLERAKARILEMGACAEKGHPFPSVVAVQYQPGRDVLVHCTGCGASYDRPATGVEKDNYSRLFQLEITI